jgi:hypothetical protein
MTKTLATAIFLCLFSGFAANAAATTQVDFAITPFSFEGVSYNQLSLDITETPRFLQAHGALISSAASTGFPVTGTCFFTSSSGVYCALKYNVFTLKLALDPEANGTYEILGPNGDSQTTGQVQLTGIE